MKERQFPRARVDCLSREFEGEVLIYDAERHVGHCLNSTAATVWKLCDGKSSPRQIATELSRQLSAPVEESVVLLALQQLADVHLLVESEVLVESPSRRVAIRRISVAAAIALPLITSLVAPTPARAASCFPNGTPCTDSAQCCSANCGSSNTCAPAGLARPRPHRSSAS